MKKEDEKIMTGMVVYGFLVKRVVELKDLFSVFYELEHEITGAKYIHIDSEDSENVFSVAFKTIPRDSTGVAHILEHAVLNGSRKFDVKSPFMSMDKRSLNTFMNAFTSTDWTMYPFATQNKKDYYNLMDVYLDAVFYPKISEESFRQEGWRLEFEKDKLVYKGVVYNEMKGSMSSPHRLLEEAVCKTLFKKTSYRFNSGGEPADIPTLSYEKFKEFHTCYYHPSNTFFYSYGNFPLKKTLKFIQDNFLKDFSRAKPIKGENFEPRRKKPVKAKFFYPVESVEEAEDKAQVVMSWLTAPIDDYSEILALSILELALLGNSASPLRKELIDSGLGSDLADVSGLETSFREAVFSCGLKGVEEKDAGKVWKLINKTLRRLADGVDQEIIESAMHQLELAGKEVINRPFPYGLNLFFRFAGEWFHGGDPLEHLELEKGLKEIRQKISSGSFMEKLIRRYFLENNHRADVLLLPDEKNYEKEDDRVRNELAKIREKLSFVEVEKIRIEAKKLKNIQEKKDDLSCLPSLDLSDAAGKMKEIFPVMSGKEGEILAYDMPVRGILYLTAAFESVKIPERLINLVPFFCFAFSDMGTRRSDYATLAKKIEAKTGGIDFSAEVFSRFGLFDDCFPIVKMNAKCLDRNKEVMFEIIEELLEEFDFSNLKRLKELLLEYRAGFQSDIVSRGNKFAASLAARGVVSACFLDESWHGVFQLKTVKEIVSGLSEKKLSLLAEDLHDLGRIIFSGKNAKMAAIGEKKEMERTIDLIAKLKNNLMRKKCTYSKGKEKFVPFVIREGWTAPSAVSFSACCFKTVALGHADAPLLSVLSHLLTGKFIHKEIREKGGAYGGYADYSSADGLFYLISYRDPHIFSTLNVFEKSFDYIRSGEFSDEDIKEAILQVCAGIDRPFSPAGEARADFNRKLIGLPDETRRDFRETVLKINRKKLLEVAEKYFNRKLKDCSVAVISSKRELDKANRKLNKKNLLLEIKKI